jgi:hypothetical protein
MDNEKLAHILIRIGIAGLVVSAIWWFIFFTEFNRASGGRGNMVEVVHCLFALTGQCSLMRGMGSMGGMLAYEPLLFWISGGVLIVGVVIKNSIAAPAGHNIMAAQPSSPDQPVPLPPNSTAVETHKGKNIFLDDRGVYCVEGHYFSSLQNARAYINGTTKAQNRSA